MVLFTRKRFTSPFILFALISSFFGVSLDVHAQYQDCSVITFDDVNTDTMTRQERIAAMDSLLFDALNQSEKCMSEAAQSSAEKVAGAAGGAGAGGGNQSASGSASSAQNSAQSEHSDTSSVTSANPPSDASKQSEGGEASAGSSAVCDAVKEGLEAATTDAEVTHFEGLKQQYGC